MIQNTRLIATNLKFRLFCKSGTMRTPFITIALSIFCLSNIIMAQDITVATASNAQYAISELIEVFEKENGVKIDHVIGSSGRLTSQIQNGAPYDIFISADSQYPQYLYENGLAKNKPDIYATGTLVLWTLKNFNLENGIDVLKSEKVQNIAIASPKSAPYGKLALQAIQSNLNFEDLKDKIVYGSSISQVNQYITLKTVDIGISTKSIVSAPQLKEVGNWKEIKGFQLNQSMILLQEENNMVSKFYNFILSPNAQRILKKHGYILNRLDGH